MLNFSNKRICVAVSGGVDSVVLLCYLKSKAETCGYTLSAVHCEHGIRGEESVADMRFVEELCRAWGIPLICFSENCIDRAAREKVSLETAARKFRYQSFASLLEGEQTDYIALAHHFGDEAETVLFRLLRGTSLTGVGGMVALNGKFMRPLLDWTKAEIVEYARRNGLAWREDRTNFERDATRNKLRLDALPLLESIVPGCAQNLVRFAALAKEDDGLLYEYAETLVSAQGKEMFVTFCERKPLFTRACLLAWKRLGLTRDYTSLHLESAYALQRLERGAKLTLPQGFEGEKRENGVAFYQKTPLTETVKGEEKIVQKGVYDGGMYLVSVSDVPPDGTEIGWNILKIDGDKLPEGTVFRFRKEGDKIERFGGGTKSLKKFFNEEKISVADREYVPLIACGSEVYAVCGVEISEKVKVTSETKTVLYIATVKRGAYVEGTQSGIE